MTVRHTDGRQDTPTSNSDRTALLPMHDTAHPPEVLTERYFQRQAELRSTESTPPMFVSDG